MEVEGRFSLKEHLLPCLFCENLKVQPIYNPDGTLVRVKPVSKHVMCVPGLEGALREHDVYVKDTAGHF